MASPLAPATKEESSGKLTKEYKISSLHLNELQREEKSCFTLRFPVTNGIL